MRTMEMAELLAGAVLRDEPVRHIRPRQSKRARRSGERVVDPKRLRVVVNGRRRMCRLLPTDVAVIRRWMTTEEAQKMGPWQQANWLYRTFAATYERSIGLTTLYHVVRGDRWTDVTAEWRPESLRERE